MNETVAIIFCVWITFLAAIIQLAQHIEFLHDSRKEGKETDKEICRHADKRTCCGDGGGEE